MFLDWSARSVPLHIRPRVTQLAAHSHKFGMCSQKVRHPAVVGIDQVETGTKIKERKDQIERRGGATLPPFGV